jgi:hypothetical protein
MNVSSMGTGRANLLNSYVNYGTAQYSESCSKAAILRAIPRRCALWPGAASTMRYATLPASSLRPCRINNIRCRRSPWTMTHDDSNEHTQREKAKTQTQNKTQHNTSQQRQDQTRPNKTYQRNTSQPDQDRIQGSAEQT